MSCPDVKCTDSNIDNTRTSIKDETTGCNTVLSSDCLLNVVSMSTPKSEYHQHHKTSTDGSPADGAILYVYLYHAICL